MVKPRESASSVPRGLVPKEGSKDYKVKQRHLVLKLKEDRQRRDEVREIVRETSKGKKKNLITGNELYNSFHTQTQFWCNLWPGRGRTLALGGVFFFFFFKAVE